jgi:leucyl aminopeptidase
MTSLNATATVSTDVLVVAVIPADGRRKGVTVRPDTGLAAAGRRKLEEALGALGARGTACEITRVPGSGIAKATMIVAVGLGASPDAETLRRTAGAVARSLAGTRRATFAFGTNDVDELEAVALGGLLGAYAFTGFKGAGTPAPTTALKAISLLTSDPKSEQVRAALARAGVLADAVKAARDLVNTPPSALTPVALADTAKKRATLHGVRARVWDEKQLRSEGFGGITAVGQGSANPPRLVRLEYRPTGAKKSLALVGKGITFDTGGISLKPPQAMETMKCDMAGAASVLEAVVAIARLGLNVNVTGWMACAENMPGGKAQRPSDVITMYGGRTVEVLNTDAEGRLVLADALVAAAADKPDLIVDVATLTGAQGIALGNRTAGVMGNDDAARDSVVASAKAAGESMWPMPLPEELRPSLDSQVADLANIGERMGGMMTGAVFLREFVPASISWAHLDIAGPAFNSGSPHGHTPKGGTGMSVRTLVRVAEDLAEGRFA